MAERSNLVVCFRSEPVDSHLIERIAASWPEVNIINTDQRGIADSLFLADYFCGHAKVPVDWDGVVSQGRLRWIQSSSAGMDWCLLPPVIASDILVTTAAGLLSDQVAEHGLALILAWHRTLRAFVLDQFMPGENPDWRRFQRKATGDFTGKSVGIVGFGGVGRRFSQVAAPFAKTIIAVDLFPENKPDHVTALWGPSRLDELLAESDVLFLALPLNIETQGMFNAKLLRRMKRGSLLVNMARGGLVVTDDLVAMLAENHLGGAVMDVTSPEPLPPDHPLWDFPNVLITPHVGGQIHSRFEDVCDIFSENVRRYKAGEPLINQLSREGKRLGFPLRDGTTPLWIDVKHRYSTR